MAGVEHCTALRIPGYRGVGAVTANFINNTVRQIPLLNPSEFAALSEHFLDLFTVSLASVRPQSYTLTRSRSVSLARVKQFVERYLIDSDLDTPKIVIGTGLSARYLNNLFGDEDTSLMRYVWHRRLDCCHQDLQNPVYNGRRISEIALKWGFNDLSHFSRAFRKRFGSSPREIYFNQTSKAHALKKATN